MQVIKYASKALMAADPRGRKGNPGAGTR